MDKKLFIESMAYLERMYGKKLDEIVIRGYWNRFNNWTDEKWKTVAARIMDTFKPSAQVPFPVMAHFIEAAGDDTKTRARTVIGWVIQAITQIGAYQSVDFGDRHLHSVILRYGGWPTICAWSNDDWRMKETAFVVAYEAAVNSGDVGPDHLVGLVEHDNMQGAYTAFLPAIQSAGLLEGTPERKITLELVQEEADGQKMIEQLSNAKSI